MPEKISVRINNEIEIEIPKGEFLLKYLIKSGIQIPTLCYHKDLKPTGICRLCIVEVEARGRKRIVTSCNYPVREPFVVWTHSERIKKHRRILAEMYLGRWPNVQVVRDVAEQCGVRESRFTSEITDENPKACILCGHCVRACEEFVLERILDFAGRGIKRHLTMPFSEVDPHCVGCTSCAYVCPTGAIEIVDDRNHPYDAKMIRDAGMKVNAELAVLDSKQCCMREVGTTNIVKTMNKYDLLPVHNYKFGKHPDAPKVDHEVLKRYYFTQGEADGCWPGCSMACAKVVDRFTLKTGPYKGQTVIVDGPEYETVAACTNMGCFDPEFVIEYNFYCDTYGIDTISMGTTTAFVMECYESGILNKERTGGLELKFGATNEVLELLHQMACGQGFGVEVGKGVRYLKEKFAREYGADPQFLQDIGMEVKGLEYSEYESKESLAQQGGYALAVKGPQHDEAWLIFMDMVNNQLPTFEKKAEALYYFPLWRTWFGLNGLCKLLWNDIVPADNYLEKEPEKVPDHVRNYCKFFEGMTGKPVTIEDLLNQSARAYNLQRVIAFMFDRGRRKDDKPPYRAIGPVTKEEYEARARKYDSELREKVGVDPDKMTIEEKIKALRKYREEQFERLTDVVYKRRGWTKDGVPKISRLKELGIDFPEIVSIIKDAQEE